VVRTATIRFLSICLSDPASLIGQSGRPWLLCDGQPSTSNSNHLNWVMALVWPPGMKIISTSLLPVAFVVTGLVAGGCAQEVSATDSAALLVQIRAQESKGLEALRTGDLTAFARSTADDALFIDPHGIATKAEVMKNVAEFRLTDFTMENVRLIPTSADSGIIAYSLTEKGVSHGHEFTVKAYISSLWAKHNGEWYCRFSQETAARK